MISKSEILMKRDLEYPLTPELSANLDKLLTAVNIFRAKYGKPMNVSSGYRPGKYNVAAGGAKGSAHLTCQAVDFADPNGDLAKFALANLPLLEEAGLWLENPAKTKGWIHLQIRPVSVRVFNP